MRHVVAYDVHARMAYKGISMEQAAAEVVNQVMRPGDGGVIAVDKDYNITMPFNSAGMYRACVDHTGRSFVGVFR